MLSFADKTNVMNIDIRKAIQSRSGYTFVAIGELSD